MDSRADTIVAGAVPKRFAVNRNMVERSLSSFPSDLPRASPSAIHSLTIERLCHVPLLEFFAPLSFTSDTIGEDQGNGGVVASPSRIGLGSSCRHPPIYHTRIIAAIEAARSRTQRDRASPNNGTLCRMDSATWAIPLAPSTHESQWLNRNSADARSDQTSSAIAVGRSGPLFNTSATSLRSSIVGRRV